MEDNEEEVVLACIKKAYLCYVNESRSAKTAEIAV